MQNILTLHNPQDARDNYLSGVWQQDTLYSLARQHARERPGACALRDPRMRLTWRELVDWVESIAQDMHSAGLCAGDRVAVWLPSQAEVVMVMLACSRNGYICTPSLHQNHTVGEVCQLLGRIQCKVLFAAQGYGADADRYSVFEQAADLPTMQRIYCVNPRGRAGTRGMPAGSVPFPARGIPPVVSQPDMNPDKITYLAFTSGTTGVPKGVMHSDNTLLANGRAMVGDWRQDPGSIVLSLSAMSHHIAIVALEQMLVTGCELVLHDPGSRSSALDWILETGATYVMGVPTHAIDLQDEMKRRGVLRLGSVRTFYLAGSVIPREVAEQFMKMEVMPQNVYGMTENGSHQYPLPTDALEAIVSTCGRACKGYEVRLFNPDNPEIECEPGEIGEIGGRGGLLMLGYFDNQVATEQSFNSRGWFLSGDLGQFDEAGCLRVVGRKKDVIIRGGRNIFPAYIEDCALRHPDILRAAAYPVAHARLGEQVCLAVIAREGVQLDSRQVLRHLRDVGLSRYDMPEKFALLDSFPLTPSGKILKRVLVEMTRDGSLSVEAVR